MAARFPQSGSSVAYKIKAAYASKIKVLYWAASADSVHRLRPGDTATTIVSRSASGAGFNADGRITGTNTSTYFSDSEANGINEQDDICFGFFGYGDAFNGVGVTSIALIQTAAPPDSFSDGAKLRAYDYGVDFLLRGGQGGGLAAGVSDNIPAYIDVAVRRNATDPINTLRQWLNGAEATSFRNNAAAASSATISNLYFGGSYAGTGNTSIQWEGCFFASGDLTDAELDAITADPTALIEESVAGATITLTDPVSVVTGSTATCTITRSTAASGTITYNLSSSATGVATVPATATIADGQTTGTFNVTGVSAGSATITATNAADSGETDTATANVSALKGLEVTFGQANLSGLTFAWFDEASPDLFDAPTVVGTTESTDGSGVMSINLTGTSVAVGNTGFLLIYKAGATAPDDIAFFGRLTVQDIG